MGHLTRVVLISDLKLGSHAGAVRAASPARFRLWGQGGRQTSEWRAPARLTDDDARWELERRQHKNNRILSGTWLSGGARPQLGVSPR
jgi:hypothetical protein